MDKPITSDEAPYGEIVKPGTYYWCACGRSSKQPFCDGSHKETNITPMEVVIEEEKEVWWCCCKQTSTKPFCDGSHREVNTD